MDEITVGIIAFLIYSVYILYLKVNHSKLKRLNLESELINSKLIKELEVLNAEHSSLLDSVDTLTENNEKDLGLLENELLEKVTYIEKLLMNNDGLLLELKEQKSLNKNLTEISVKLQNRIDGLNN